MKSVTVAELQRHCSQLIKEVIETGSPVVIVDNGHPVAQLGRATDLTPTVLGAHKGKIRIVGDILEPVGDTWEAEH